MQAGVNCCPKCGADSLGVVETRKHDLGGISAIRRRKRCTVCRSGFYTLEIAEALVLAADLPELLKELSDG